MPLSAGRWLELTATTSRSATTVCSPSLSPPDYEHPSDDNNNNEYLLEVWARAGASDPIAQGVTVTVNDDDEDAIVVLSSPQPQIGSPLQATITDPDGVLSVSTWTWQQSMDRTTWTDVAVGHNR